MSDQSSMPPLENSPPPTTDISALVSGIIQDIQLLVKQQIQLTRQELVANIKLRGVATAFYGIAVGLAGLSIVMFCQALAHGLHWWSLTVSTRPPGMPLAACYGIVGAVLLMLSLILISVGRMKLCTLPALPQLTIDQTQEQQP